MAIGTPLSPGEQRVFLAVAEAVVGAPVPRSAAELIQPFVERLGPADRRLLALLLRAVEHGMPLLRGRLARFTSLDRAERERCLLDWRNSRLAVRRQAAGTLRTLSALACYAHEDAWEAVGYDGPWLGRIDVPVLPAPDIRAPGAPSTAESPPSGLPAGVTAGRDVRRDLTLRVQACVIGTGAGGAAALAILAARGLDVIGLEAGGHLTADRFNQREADMLPLLFQEAGLRATADKAIGILQGRGVGGSTLHNTGLVYSPPPGVIDRWRTEHAFPPDHGGLAVHVAQALDALRARPVPEEAINANNEALRRGAAALGWQYRVPLHSRADCCGCGYCIVGCAYNRKFNSSLTFLPRAVAAGARILADAPVTRIEGPAGARRIVCELQDGQGRATGHRAIIEAPVVLVAAGAIDTPAVLLRSGLGPATVGAGLRLHPSALVGATFEERIEAWRGLPQSVVVEEFAHFRDTGRGGYLIIPLAAPPGIAAMLVPHVGAAHRRAMLGLARTASAAVVLHDEGTGRVRLRRDGRPAADYWLSRSDASELQDGMAALGRLYFAAGAGAVHLPYAGAPPARSETELDALLKRFEPARHRLTLNSVHPQGSCPLGSDPRRSAVDPHGEVWGTPGVYVCDASLFPTSVGVPPQVTVMALASAVAEYAADRRLPRP